MSRIVAIVAVNAQRVDGGAPIFIAKDDEEQRKIAFTLEKILDATTHYIDDEIYILVNHHPHES